MNQEIRPLITDESVEFVKKNPVQIQGFLEKVVLSILRYLENIPQFIAHPHLLVHATNER